MTRHPRRSGFTLFELIVVMAILLLFIVLIMPSLEGLGSGNHSKVAGDQIRGELAAARAWAMQEGIPIRVALSPDGTKIRRSPENEFDQQAAQDVAVSARRVEYTFDKATATVTATNTDGSTSQQTADDTGWVTIAVVLSDGTCRDDRVGGDGNQIVTVAVRDEGMSSDSGAVNITILGITGQVSTTTGTQKNNGGRQ